MALKYGSLKKEDSVSYESGSFRRGGELTRTEFVEAKS